MSVDPVITKTLTTITTLSPPFTSPSPPSLGTPAIGHACIDQIHIEPNIVSHPTKPHKTPSPTPHTRKNTITILHSPSYRPHSTEASQSPAAKCDHHTPTSPMLRNNLRHPLPHTCDHERTVQMSDLKIPEVTQPVIDPTKADDAYRPTSRNFSAIVQGCSEGSSQRHLRVEIGANTSKQ
ncbi:hypothetical protein HK102_000817 [Quaeritorhiza haematococci]|nr:hypothetical protein HK102_000816 [Quaeritorhiza haematococci]KAJ3083959.1 hypothetical protein HK102_000817 [Quaeritorhiza haematococci]